MAISSETYQQRKRVMVHLYDARSIVGESLPWIRVRIAPIKSLGLCYIERNHIVISDRLNDWNDDFLRLVVWHELCHAYFKAEHNESCALMMSSVAMNERKDRNTLEKALKRLAEKGKT